MTNLPDEIERPKCPVCGSILEIVDHGRFMRIRCNGCKMICQSYPKYIFKEKHEFNGVNYVKK